MYKSWHNFSEKIIINPYLNNEFLEVMKTNRDYKQNCTFLFNLLPNLACPSSRCPGPPTCKN
jgi:hypothetical protein